MTLDELVNQLKLAYGGALRSVVLYGSAVAGEHIAKKSDYNVLVVVESITIGNLRKDHVVAQLNPPARVHVIRSSRPIEVTNANLLVLPIARPVPGQ